MFPDAGGVRDTFHAMAQRLADLGYAVLLPDPYYRIGPVAPFDMDTVFADPDERKRLMELVGSVTKDAATRDTGAYPRVPGRAARGGRHQGRHDRLLHGRRAGAQRRRPLPRPGRRGGVVPRRPDRQRRRPTARTCWPARWTATVYVAGARDDGSFDDEQFQRLSTALTEAGVDHTLVTYPALHGFAVPDNPTYDEAAATRHWEALESLYAAALVDV